MKHVLSTVAFAATIFVSGAANAAVVLPNTTWSTLFGENGGGGSSAITKTVARNGDGSVEMTGDRTRYSMGNYYNPASNLGLVSTVLGIAYDWRVAKDSSGAYNVDQTPALRIHIYDGGKRSELIWEGSNNGAYGKTNRDTWYSTTFNDSFYQYVDRVGVTFQNGSQVNRTVADWTGAYSANAYVSAISVGVGSGFSKNYHAFADNVVFAKTTGTTTYNFNVTASAVPEPATWGMMILGMGMIGAGLRSRRKQAVRVTYA